MFRMQEQSHKQDRNIRLPATIRREITQKTQTAIHKTNRLPLGNENHRKTTKIQE